MSQEFAVHCPEASHRRYLRANHSHSSPICLSRSIAILRPGPSRTPHSVRAARTGHVLDRWSHIGGQVELQMPIGGQVELQMPDCVALGSALAVVSVVAHTSGLLHFANCTRFATGSIWISCTARLLIVSCTSCTCRSAKHSAGATCTLPGCILLHLWKGSSRSSSRAPARQGQRRRARAFDRRYSRGASPPRAQHRRVVGGFSCAPLVRTQPYLQPKARAPRRTARQADCTLPRRCQGSSRKIARLHTPSFES